MSPLKRLFSFTRRYWYKYVLGLFVLFFTDLFMLFTPKFTGFAIDGIRSLMAGVHVSANIFTERSFLFPYNEMVENLSNRLVSSGLIYFLLFAAGVILFVNILSNLFRVFWRLFIMKTSYRVDYDIRDVYYKKLLSLPMEFYSRYSTGELMSRATSDLHAVRMTAGPGILALFDPLFMGVLAIVNMISINPKLTLLSLIPLPLIAALVFIFERIIFRYFKEVQQKFSSLTNYSQNSFNGIKIIKSYTKEVEMADNFDEYSSSYRSSFLKLVRVEGLFHPMIILFSSMSLIVILYYGGKLVIDGTVTIGNFYAFQMYLMALIWPMVAIGWVITLWARGMASMSRINEVLESENTLICGKDSIDKINKIEFKNVWFKYPKSKSWILEDISFSFKSGEKIAFVGKIGTGKSTITELLLRFYDPQKGEIIINDRPIKEFSLETLRSSIGYIPQDSFLFSESLRDNLALSFDKDENLMERVIMNAGLTDTISEFKDGLETVVGEKGITLSGGQRQRMTIARALYRQPAFIIFDDSFSSIDSHIEEKILSSLGGQLKDVMQLFIAHRLSTIQNVDKIFVLRSGKIVESGRYDELLKKQNEFYRIYLTQQLEEEK